MKPYLEVVVSHTEYRYNPDYGDDRICKCGHQYHRHFDSYENMEACGCKYCGCHHFEEQETFQEAFSDLLSDEEFRHDLDRINDEE